MTSLIGNPSVPHATPEKPRGNLSGGAGLEVPPVSDRDTTWIFRLENRIADLERLTVFLHHEEVLPPHVAGSPLQNLAFLYSFLAKRMTRIEERITALEHKTL